MMFSERILGQHGADYTRNMPEEDEEEEARKKQFSKYIKLGVNPDSSKGRYTKTHAAIRTNSSAKAKADKKVSKRRGPLPGMVWKPGRPRMLLLPRRRG